MVPHHIHMAPKGGSSTSSAAMLARLLPLLLLAAASNAYGGAGQPPISRRSFPEGFIFGTASAAYQVVATVLISHLSVMHTCVHSRVKGPAGHMIF